MNYDPDATPIPRYGVYSRLPTPRGRIFHERKTHFRTGKRAALEPCGCRMVGREPVAFCGTGWRLYDSGQWFAFERHMMRTGVRE